MLRNKIAVRGLTAGSISLFAICAYAQAPLATYTDLHDFGSKITGPSGLQTDGSTPTGKVSFDSAGNMYGTTSAGANGNSGLVWEITNAGVYKVLHNFGGTTIVNNGTTGNDGSGSQAGVTIDASGNLYGTTSDGGLYGKGIVWEIASGGYYIDVFDFGAGATGSYPNAGVTVDSSGNLYGTAVSGGVGGNKGLVWELQGGFNFTVLHNFGLSIVDSTGSTGTDGFNPYGGVTLDSAGNLYGTTTFGGHYSEGVLWEISKTGTYTDLRDFGKYDSGTGTIYDGMNPRGSVVFDSSNNMYGTCQVGGPVGSGIVWERTSAGTYSILHNFLASTITTSSGQNGYDGDMPNGDVALDGSGNLYGTTGEWAHPDKGGMVWEITKGGSYVDLHDFGGASQNVKIPSVAGGIVNDGQLPVGGVALDSFGNLYGTTTVGGASGTGATGAGMVWTIGSLKSLSLVPGSVAAGAKTAGTLTLGMPAPIGGTVVMLSSTDTNAGPPSLVKFPAGSASASFSIGTARVTAMDTVTITASQMYATLTQSLTISPATIGGFSYFNGPKGGTTATINVDLTAPAPTGGMTVTLSSNSAKASVPATVVVPAGATSASFTVTYGTVTTATPVVITGTVGTVSATANITIKP